ncbi:MAG: hypothetical protein MJE68_06075 [Proteobacteria bacterium]|nr:hypothetical protein [Pseudomonadota bacterium]
MAAKFASDLTAQCVDDEDDDIELVEANEDQPEDDGIYLSIVLTIAEKNIYSFLLK